MLCVVLCCIVLCYVCDRNATQIKHAWASYALTLRWSDQPLLCFPPSNKQMFYCSASLCFALCFAVCCVCRRLMYMLLQYVAYEDKLTKRMKRRSQPVRITSPKTYVCSLSLSLVCVCVYMYMGHWLGLFFGSFTLCFFFVFFCFF